MNNAAICCPSCQASYDASGPGYPALRSCPDCHGTGVVAWCSGCESSYRDGSRDALSIERAGRCESCVRFEARQAKEAA